MYTTRNLGKNIKRAREMQRIKQNELAAMSSISKSAMSRYEAGIIKPSIGHFLRIREALNTPFERLLM